jgi:hypothetical protein
VVSVVVGGPHASRFGRADTMSANDIGAILNCATLCGVVQDMGFLTSISLLANICQSCPIVVFSGAKFKAKSWRLGGRLWVTCC